MLELFSRSDLNEFGEGHHLIADKRVEAGHAVIYLDVSGAGDSVSRGMTSVPKPPLSLTEILVALKRAPIWLLLA